MPRSTQTRANARPDTTIGGRRVRPRGGITPERPGRSQAAQTADALVSVAGVAGSYAERKAEEQREEDAKQQRLEAFKDFHEDVSQDVTREQAKQRAAFGDEAYSSAYMRLSYARKARDESADLAEQVREWNTDPDIGVDEIDRRVDSYVSGIVSGLDDPDAVDVYANRLSSDAEQLKAQSRETAIQRQQADGQSKLNAQIDDMADEGVLGQPEALDMLERQGAALNVARGSVHAAMANALIRKASEAKDPDILAPLFREGEDGTSLADDPDIRASVLQARDRVEAEAEQQTTAAELTQRYELRRKIERGGLTMADIQRVNRDNPDWYTPDQLASMLTRSQDTARQAAAEQREAAAMTAGRVSPVAMRMKTHGDQQTVFGHMRRGIFSAHEDSPDGQRQAFMDYATRVAELSGGVSGVKDDWLAAQLNAEAGAPSADGSMPDGFRAGYQRYRMLKQDPQTRGLLDNILRPEARRMYQRVEDYAESGDYVQAEDGGRDITPAYAKASRDLANPIDLETFQSSESFAQLRSAVSDVTDIGSFLGEDYGGETGTVTNALDVKHDIRKMAEREMRYSRASLDQALSTARERYKATHTLVRGTYIRGNYGNDATDAVNAKLDEELPAIREHSGEDVTDADLSIMDAGNGRAVVMVGNNQIAMTDNGRGGLKPVTFDMAEAREAYREDMRPKGPTSERVDTQDYEPAPPPAPGSPAAMSEAGAEDRRQTREAIGRAVGSAWQSVRDKLAEEREQQTQQPGSAPGKMY